VCVCERERERVVCVCVCVCINTASERQGIFKKQLPSNLNRSFALGYIGNLNQSAELGHLNPKP